MKLVFYRLGGKYMLPGRFGSEYISDNDVFYCYGGKKNVVYQAASWISISSLPGIADIEKRTMIPTIEEIKADGHT